MNKTIITLVLLMAGSAPAMQRQKEREQQQKEKKKDKKKQDQDKNNPVEQPTDPEVADLLLQMQAIEQNITQTYGSITNMVEKLKHKEHQRICPTCGRPAEECGVDIDRIAHGNIMLCGCSICGGLQI